MLSSKRGAAILQVLLVAAVLAGVSVMLLRTTLARTSSARQTRRTVAAELLIDSCMAEINQLMVIKSPEAFARDMRDCSFYCKGGPYKLNFNESCSEGAPQDAYQAKNYECRSPDERHVVQVGIRRRNPEIPGDCEIGYRILDASDL